MGREGMPSEEPDEKKGERDLESTGGNGGVSVLLFTGDRIGDKMGEMVLPWFAIQSRNDCSSGPTSGVEVPKPAGVELLDVVLVGVVTPMLPYVAATSSKKNLVRSQILLRLGQIYSNIVPQSGHLYSSFL